ncbi:MAG: hypothetical protein M1838_001274 [Thelocarpon superellum]|nr:MAG: hypothetical protein M1838_001274 [Thelocarpon superellum]
MSSDAATTTSAPPTSSLHAAGVRKNGKQWHTPKSAFRPTAGLTSWAERSEARKAQSAVKAREQEMKAEKEAERQVCNANHEHDNGCLKDAIEQRRIQTIKDKRSTKEEKQRYEKLAEKMHKKRVERLKRKEKRNKLLNA